MGFTEPTAIATPCDENGKNDCSEFQICLNSADNQDFSCYFYECSCLNGTEATEKCTFDEENVCESCDSFYHLEDSSCVENTCSCQNGSPVDNSACENDLSNQ